MGDNEITLDAVLENSFDGIYITDGEANTIKLNKAYENITGLKKDEVLNKNMKDLVKNNIISKSGSILAIKNKKPVTLCQEFKTGKKAIISSSPVFDKKGNVIMVVTNVRDMTEIYRLREEMEEKERHTSKLNAELEIIKTKVAKRNDIVAVDKNTLNVLHLANKVSVLDTPVILFGETGVGKEVFAQYIYRNSSRSKERFIKVNCAAIPQNLIESELFGYASGAFTGADKNGKMGLFELADKGTIFLDEVGELPIEMQSKILRVLQEKEIRRVGSPKSILIDVRVIAATNRDLKEMVRNKTFREDLYYRLVVFPITIPPLRDRVEDIEPLVKIFTEKINNKYRFNKSFTQEAVQLLKDYHWPGNIRELVNVVERALIISSREQIYSSELPMSEKKDVNIVLRSSKNLKDILEEIEFEYISAAYEEYKNVRDAASSLGMDASTFVRKRKKYLKNK